MKEFVYQGVTLQFKEDLRKYHDLKCEFDIEKISIINKTLPYSLDYHKASQFFGEINDGIQNFAKKLISKLSEYDIYDRTVSDMLNKNSGYREYVKVVDVYTKSLKDIYEKRDALTDSELAKAKAKAESNIQGLGFNVYSSSLTAHLLYAAQESRELKRQIKQAEAEYNAERSRITSEINSQVESAIYDIYRQGTQTIFSVLEKCINELFVFYSNELGKVGALDTSCSEQMNDERANELLQNIENVQNPGKLIAKALQYSPYFLDSYDAAFSYNIFDKDIVSIIVYLNNEDSVKDYLLEKKIHAYTDLGTAEKFCLENRKLFQIFSLIDDIDINDEFHFYTDDIYENVLKRTENLIIKSRFNDEGKDNLYFDLKDKYGFKSSSEIVDIYLRNFKNDLSVLDKENIFLENECRWDSVFETLADLYNSDFYDYSSFLEYLKNNLMEKLENYDSWLTEIREIEEQAEAKKKEEEKKNAEEKAKEKKEIRTVLIAFVCIVIVVATVSTILSINKEKNKYKKIAEQEIVYSLKMDDYHTTGERQIVQEIKKYNFDKASNYETGIEQCEYYLDNQTSLHGGDVKTAYDMFLKGCAMKYYSTSKDDWNWYYGDRYIFDCFTNLHKIKMVDLNDETLSVFVQLSMRSQALKLLDSDIEAYIDENGKTYIPFEIENHTGFYIDSIEFTLKMDDDSFATIIDNFENNTTRDLVFDISSQGTNEQHTSSVNIYVDSIGTIR